MIIPNPSAGPIAAAILFASQLHPHTYYVAGSGNDNASGRSPRAAWKTLERVNRQPFEPGDSIRFKAGDEWHGQLHPSGSGSPRKPIRIDRFGKGPSPVIN